MKAQQVFDRLLLLQYRLDTTPPEESPQIFEDYDLAIEEFQSLTGCTPDEIQDALNERYPAFIRMMKGK